MSIIGMDGKKIDNTPTPIKTKSKSKTWHFAIIDSLGNDFGFTREGTLFMGPGTVGLVDDDEVILAFVPVEGLTYVQDVPSALNDVPQADAA